MYSVICKLTTLYLVFDRDFRILLHLCPIPSFTLRLTRISLPFFWHWVFLAYISIYYFIISSGNCNAYMSLYAIDSKCFEEDDKLIIWTNCRLVILNVCIRNTIQYYLWKTPFISVEMNTMNYIEHHYSLLLYGIWVANNLKVIEKWIRDIK